MTVLHIALIGYGKMGKEIEKLATEMNHKVFLTLDSEKDWEIHGADLSRADVALEFSHPSQATANIRKCFDAGVPVVSGTTGWYEELDQIRAECIRQKKCLFYASNFSISVNIFFEINRRLARMMNSYKDYEVNIEEIHHIHKVDAPSGTAISLANDIIRNMERKEKWNPVQLSREEIAIKSVRQENEPGTHIVTYDSSIDSIEIKHTVKNRRGFALGALMAAEFVFGKQGVYTMTDLLKFE